MQAQASNRSCVFFQHVTTCVGYGVVGWICFTRSAGPICSEQCIDHKGAYTSYSFVLLPLLYAIGCNIALVSVVIQWVDFRETVSVYKTVILVKLGSKLALIRAPSQ